MLDESAIEAMIARQREVQGQQQGTPESVRTVQTDEFEVYERKAEPEPEPEPAPQAPAQQPVEQQEEFEVFEREPAPEPEPQPRPEAPSPAPPQPTPYPNTEAPAPRPTPAPTPQPAAEPAPATAPVHHPVHAPPVTEPVQEPVQEELPTQPFAPQRTRRPEVWPPIGARDGGEPETSRRTHAPEGTAPRTATPDAHAYAPSPAPGGDAPRLAIVQSLFNEEITGDMLGLARQKADKLGAPVVQHATVPGVYDMPLVVQTLLARDDVDAVVVLGCVVTGETKHDELITHATAKTLQEVSLAAGKPVGLGIIGPGMTWKQAEARVVNGKHAVEAAVAQYRVVRGLTV